MSNTQPKTALGHCKQCPHFATAAGVYRCALYLRKCSLAKMLRGDLPPPDRCPHREQLERVLPG